MIVFLILYAIAMSWAAWEGYRAGVKKGGTAMLHYLTRLGVIADRRALLDAVYRNEVNRNQPHV